MKSGVQKKFEMNANRSGFDRILRQQMQEKMTDQYILQYIIQYAV